MAAAKASEPAVLEGSGEQPTARAEAAGRQSGVTAGQVLVGRYRLEALLGRGGMGEVWRAEHLLTNRQVAVKLLRNTLVHQPDMRRRFLREARVAAAVNHPNVVEVLDAFELDDGTPALVMPLLEGETLGSLLLREGPLSLEAALQVLVPLLSAVAAAHERRIIHRDLKPDNVFLVREGNRALVKVLDFGIAKLIADEDSGESTITGTGTLIGTPCYMAPEQAFGERDQDHRVDIYAIGVVAYEVLSGCRPVEGDNIGHVVKALLTQACTPLSVVAPQVPAPISALVMRLLARDKTQRPQTLAEVLAELEAFEQESPLPATPSGTPSASGPPHSSSTLVSPREGRGVELRSQPGASVPLVTPHATPVEQAITQNGSVEQRRSLLAALAAVVGFGVLAMLVWHSIGAPRASTGAASDVSGAVATSSEVTPSAASAASSAVHEVPSAAPSAAHGSANVAPSAEPVKAASPPVAAKLQVKPAPSASAKPAPAPRREGLQEEPPF